MNKNIKLIGLFASLAIFSVGCSTIIKGTTQVLTVTSEPSNADVLIDGNIMGKTPLSVTLKKNMYNTIMVKKVGYNTQTKQLQKAYDPVTLLSIFWDLSTTDLVSGAAYEYQPNTYHYALEAEEGQSTPRAKGK